MQNENIEMLNVLKLIIEKHQDVVNDYYNVLSNYDYKIMSKGDDLYGMFYPDRQLEKYFKYKGKVTKNEKNKDFAYYFDKEGKLLLTERYSDGCLLNSILFYYYKDLIEIVWYCMERKKISVVGEVVYQNNILADFVWSGDVAKKVRSFRKYTFNTEDDYINIRSYMKYSEDGEFIMNSKLKK